MGVVEKLWQVADRTAVLAVGLIAGFAIGLSFNAGGWRQVAGWLQPDSGFGVAIPAVPAAARGGVAGLAAPIAPIVARRVAADGRLRIGVFGDSFGNGLWDALYRQLPAAERYDVLKFSKEATGFTRYHSLDLEEEARRQLARQPVDVAIICFGANDLQPIYEGRGLQPLLSDKWKRIVGTRIDRFVAAVRSTGATPVWVGLPAMRDSDVDDQIRALDGFYAERLAALQVPFVDTRPASLDADGHYNAHLVNAATGRTELVRTPDGMHMTGIGYRRITAGLVAELRAYMAKGGHATTPTVAAPAVVVAPVRPSPTLDRPRRAAPAITPGTSADAAEREARQTARANRREADRVRRMEKDDRPANAIEPAEAGK